MTLSPSLPLPQPTCLAEFKQIKSIRCLPLEEGQAVLQLGIEGAPQVSIRVPPKRRLTAGWTGVGAGKGPGIPWLWGFY